MTVAATNAWTGPLVASGTNPLNFNFQAIAADEIAVIKNGVKITTGFTVTLNGNMTGSVTPTTSWGTSQVYIISDPDFGQETSFGRFTGWYPDQLVPPLDTLAKQIIYLKDQVDRALKVARGGTGNEFSLTTDGVIGVIGGALSFYPAATFNGAPGTNGTNGTNAQNPNYTFAVNTLAAGNIATLNVTGTYPNLTLTFGVPAGPSGGTTWGAITGTLSLQSDLNTALNAKAELASPTFTGVPAAPTAVADTNTTQLATTGFVIGQANSTAGTIAMNGTQAAGTSLKFARADHVHPTDSTRAPLASPTFTGTPAAPTPAYGVATTQLATMAALDRLRDVSMLSSTGLQRSLALTDRGQTVPNTLGGWLIPANASVAFPVGTVIWVYNDSAASQTLDITIDTLRLAGSATTGARTVPQRGLAFVFKTASTEWVVGGNVS